MKALSRILFPSVVTAVALSGAIGFNREPVETLEVPVFSEVGDTVIYPHDGYRLRRNAAQLQEAVELDSILALTDADTTSFILDTVPHLTARDTIKVPDSLRFSDPFRFKYYIALLDSLTHVNVVDSLKKDFRVRTEAGDSLAALRDSLDWMKIDSIYCADSAAAAIARFKQWYASLSKEERKAYDNEQKALKKLAAADSLRVVKEQKQSARDSIIENTPRILETFALPDSMQYKRIIAWTLDQDFQKMNVYIPDTSYNYHFYDYPIYRKDVNATWLGVPGSPAQYYNFFNRSSDSNVEFYKAQEPWAFSVHNLPHYNSKTPYTELAYFGTILAKKALESDNLHIMTLQNITPELNVSLQFDRFGGGGMLESEETANRNFVARTNFLGKKYLMHAGYISNYVGRQENGGITENRWITDTTVDARTIAVHLNGASSRIKKNTFFLDQQWRIPFNFINRIKARKDSTFIFNADSLQRDITTAYIGHSSEFSTYTRHYKDNISGSPGSDFYHDVFNYGKQSLDSMRVMHLENKVFLRLQPWSSEGIVSKLDLGLGDYLRTFYAQKDTAAVRGSNVTQNSAFVYAGAEGQIRNFFNWNAKARTVFLGEDAGDFLVEANAGFNAYPFRRAKGSPLSLKAHFETGLKNPTFYEKHIFANHYAWDRDDFKKISTTKLQAELNIPHWKLNLKVGYALLNNNLFYDSYSIIQQNSSAMSVFSANLKKEFVLGPLHLDNNILYQKSSRQEVVPVPELALNLKYYFQFVVQRNADKTANVMVMQIGLNGWWNTAWNAPAWNPNLGVFFNQTTNSYNNGPYFDLFVNVQWKRCCIFLKYQNIGQNIWPKKPDYFSADHYILVNQTGIFDPLKIGIMWPFYMQPAKKSSRSGS